MLDDSLKMNVLYKWLKWKAPFHSVKMVRAIRDALVTRKVKPGGGIILLMHVTLFKAILCARIFFALHEPLPVHLPCLNFVLYFTYHLPPPCTFSSLGRSGSKIPTRSCGSQNKHLWIRGFADNTEAAKNVFLAKYLANCIFIYYFLTCKSDLQIWPLNSTGKLNLQI